MAQDLSSDRTRAGRKWSRFRISGLSPEPVAEFSIEDSPCDPVLATYFSGQDMARNFLFLSRRQYGEQDVLAVANSGFLSS